MIIVSESFKIQGGIASFELVATLEETGKIVMLIDKGNKQKKKLDRELKKGFLQAMYKQHSL